MKLRVFLQSQTAECGLACLATIASWHGHRVDLPELRRKFPISMKGATLRQLMANAAVLGLTSRPVRLEMSELRDLQLPCIVHINLSHFVVLHKVTRKAVYLVDPAVGERRIELPAFSKQFTGVALELSPSADFKPQAPVPRVKLSALTGRVTGLKRSLAQIFVLAMALEFFAVLAPLLNQLVVDDALASHDTDLLTLLVLGFGVLLLVQTAIGLARSWVVMVLGQSIQLQWVANVFAHLLRLPVTFFEQRHLGDVVSRFGAVGEIQRTLTTALVESVLDGLMAVAALGMMALYSPSLCAVVVGAVLLYALLRWAGFQSFRDAAAERLVVASRESSHFLETIRAITPIKLFGREQERRARWQNLTVEVQNRDVRTAKLGIAFSAANTFVFGAENLAVLWLGAQLVMEGPGSPSPFTIGMLFAFMAYKGQFTGRVAGLIDYAVKLRMIGLHSERLGDIVLHPPETDATPENPLDHLPPSLELRDVSFRYGEGEPWVLRNVNLRVEGGDIVAVTGPSGAGKTTLMKLLLGLLTPVEGDVLYGGVPIRQLGITNFRRCVGTVVQDDALLTGSILENISFFDAQADVALTEECARLAQLHDEICRMPMGYQTLIGDLGSGLSGGQKQRLLLARALYKRPRVLALDEATSHLDAQNERAIADALAHMKLTRLLVAHRAETIASARRVIQVRDGAVGDVLHQVRLVPDAT